MFFYKKIWLILLLLLILPASSHAQKKQSLWVKADSLLAYIFRAKGDTNYVTRPDKRLTLRLLNNVSGTNFIARENSKEIVGSVFFKDPLRYTITLSANYRGLAASLAFNPSNIFGKHSSTEFNINSYSNKYGFDILFENNGQYSATAKVNGQYFDVGEVDVKEKSLTINGYYAFNGDRFSYPAAFSQSFIQKRSVGSLMAGISYHRSTLRMDHYEDVEYDDIRKIKTSYAGLGIGYGYNFVPSRKWLIHISALPTLVLWNESKVVYAGYVKDFDRMFPEYSIVGRFAIIHYYKSFFTGATLVLNFTTVGDIEALRLTHNKWRSRFIIGMRF